MEKVQQNLKEQVFLELGALFESKRLGRLQFVEAGALYAPEDIGEAEVMVEVAMWEL